MKMHIGRGKIGLLVGFFALLALPAPAARAAVQGIGVSPTSRDVTVSPGQTQTGTFTVINDGATDIVYKLYATDYSVQGEDYKGDFDLTGASSDVSAVSWVKLPGGKFTVKSNDQTEIKYTITVPKTAVVGGHYLTIFAETVPPASPGGTRIARIDRIGTFLYLAVDGDLHHQGELKPLDAPWLQSVAPIKAYVRMSNGGNVHYPAEGTLQLKNIFGGTVGHAIPLKGTILPQTTRRFTLELPSAKPLGLYKVVAKVKYLDRDQEISSWVLLVPKLTFMIVSGSLMLVLMGGFIWLVRRRRN
jgi:hypothetical protein